MARCTGTKRNGDRCEVVVGASKTYCYQHDPARAQERKRNASKGGKSTGGREIKDLKTQVRTVVGGVLTGRFEPKQAAVGLQGYNVLLRALELERRIKETGELEDRLQRLEQASESGATKWGA